MGINGIVRYCIEYVLSFSSKFHALWTKLEADKHTADMLTSALGYAPKKEHVWWCTWWIICLKIRTCPVCQQLVELWLETTGCGKRVLQTLDKSIQAVGVSPACEFTSKWNLDQKSRVNNESIQPAVGLKITMRTLSKLKLICINLIHELVDWNLLRMVNSWI